MQAEPPKLTLLATLVRHYDELVEHVRRRFGERVFAREVVHDVCVQLLEGDEKQGVRTPLALLRKIAHDTASTRYRSDRRREAWVVAVPELPEVASTAPSQQRHLESARALELLTAAIAALPPRCQMVFVMHKVYELPQAEVAKRMGISLKTVEKHLRQGMSACREHLGAEVLS
ncbi:RNA polymerase sigma factor [Pseudomonas auratipiscis]|uniref:RNA polymerase sigma factor n=1 Tax=Pseudomonas auratipiscis TaxID=3115853 RepID=A0AB35WL90_9PSED|nr:MULTISPECIES: RNA polymerase sigma factor [unclassified Pseudomonas]MEE1864937.1 RNA polymerase sigma factor [Pseudomonas sp. 120P]MEE1956122.1 RNA polymerase sigma factor [Pseudomonas sp. 119P]